MLIPAPRPVKPAPVPASTVGTLRDELESAPRACSICGTLLHYAPSPNLGAVEPGHVYSVQGLIEASLTSTCEWCFEAMWMHEGH